MSTRKHIVRTKNYRVQVERYYHRLETLKSKGDKRGFYKTFVAIIPELRNYIKTRLQEMIHQGHFPHNFYEEDDFVDDLFIAVYDNFETLKNEEEFYMYLFDEMNNLLETVQRTEEKLHQPLEDIETYAKAERDKLREKITAQLDGDRILKQELDDISYASLENEFKTIFEVDSEKAVVEHLDKELIHSLTSKQIDKLIGGNSQNYRNIGTLFTHFHLTIPEIVKITKISHQEVDRTIKQIKETLKKGLFNL